ncbi:MAG: hypothetical protein ACTSQG_08745 [Promethearchaeota archaeon]
MKLTKIAIINLEPLIHLARVGLIDYLFLLYIKSLFQNQFITKWLQKALIIKSEVILLDDEEARVFARNLKLNIKGTLGTLIDLVKFKHFNIKSALKYLKELNTIMYLSSDIDNLVADELKKFK